MSFFEYLHIFSSTPCTGRWSGFQAPRGEYVLVVSGKDRKELEAQAREAWEELTFSEHMAIYESQEIPRKEAMKLVAKDRGISKRDVYQALLSEES